MAGFEPREPEGADELLEAIGGLLLPTLRALDALRFASRHLHPDHLQHLVAAVMPAAEPVRGGAAAFHAADWPEPLTELRDAVAAAAELAGRAFDGLHEAAAGSDMRTARRALRLQAGAHEALWPTAGLSPLVSRFFLDDASREDEALCARLEDDAAGRGDVGVFHFDNGADDRGGCSVFVPERHDAGAPPPVIVAHHGGSGHGRAFLWNWLPAARAAEVILVSPTSIGRTWALQGDDVDTPNVRRMLDRVGERWPFDANRMLFAGMSDGGTFCWTSGLLEDSPFTHLAPFSASFHPLLLEFAAPERLRDLPVHIVHGALDWMFPPEIASGAADGLRERGAHVVHREIPDLSHTFATDEVPAVIEWFLQAPAQGGG